MISYSFQSLSQPQLLRKGLSVCWGVGLFSFSCAAPSLIHFIHGCGLFVICFLPQPQQSEPLTPSTHLTLLISNTISNTRRKTPNFINKSKQRKSNEWINWEKIKSWVSESWIGVELGWKPITIYPVIWAARSMKGAAQPFHPTPLNQINPTKLKKFSLFALLDWWSLDSISSHSSIHWLIWFVSIPITPKQSTQFIPMFEI